MWEGRGCLGDVSAVMAVWEWLVPGERRGQGCMLPLMLSALQHVVCSACRARRALVRLHTCTGSRFGKPIWRPLASYASYRRVTERWV